MRTLRLTFTFPDGEILIGKHSHKIRNQCVAPIWDGSESKLDLLDASLFQVQNSSNFRIACEAYAKRVGANYELQYEGQFIPGKIDQFDDVNFEELSLELDKYEKDS